MVFETLSPVNSRGNPDTGESIRTRLFRVRLMQLLEGEEGTTTPTKSLTLEISPLLPEGHSKH
jgi:hypothetical protein